MKIKYIFFGIGMLFFIQSDVYNPSQIQARYSLLQDEISIEVGSGDKFDPYQFLLRNRHSLKEDEKQNFVINGEVDLETLGTYQIAFNDMYLLKVNVEDTTAPKVQLHPLHMQRDQSFVWNEETYASIVSSMEDNHTSQEILKKSLSCDDIDTRSAGEKQITCRVKDENGNETSIKLAVSISSPIASSPSTPNTPSNKNVMGTMTTVNSIPNVAYPAYQMSQIKEVASLVNEIRSENGLKAVHLDLGVYHNVTYQRALEVRQFYSHTRPNGQSCYTIFSDYGVGFYSTGENIGQGQQSAQEVVNDWMNSTSHRENILRPEFRILSVGIVGEGAQKIWIQIFFN